MGRSGLEGFLDLASLEPELELSVRRIVELEAGAAEALVAIIERHGFSCSFGRAAAYVEEARRRGRGPEEIGMETVRLELAPKPAPERQTS
jgi:hypothetical protein